MPELNMTFDEVATLYHKVRPRYPESWFDRLAELANPGPDVRVLELGSGTGIATRPMLERGWWVDCVEPGASLADVAHQQLREFDRLHIDVAPFEEWSGTESHYDAIVSATAFHWIKRDARYTKPHRYLKPAGLLAVMHYRHVSGGDEAMFDEIQDCYLAHMPGTTRERLPDPSIRTQSASEMRKSGLFEIVESTSVVEIETYSRTEYLDLISTYSGHRMLGDEGLARLQGCIAAVIDRGGGNINKAYAQELVIGRRVDNS